MNSTSKASGKLGTLIAATMIFNCASDSRSFLSSGCCCFTSNIIALVNTPENHNLDSFEIDKKMEIDC